MEGYNTKRLANILAERMKMTANEFFRPPIELGRYNRDGSITPDSLRIKIPRGEYMINFVLTEETSTSHETVTLSGGGHAQKEGSGEHQHVNDGRHNHILPDKLHPLKSGDRILIAWCGTEPVVIAKVKSSG